MAYSLTQTPTVGVCPKSLESVAPCEFADHLSAKQVKAFSLQKSPDGLFLKTNHAYYYLMQLQMGMCEMGYFVVWTPLGRDVDFTSAKGLKRK